MHGPRIAGAVLSCLLFCSTAAADEPLTQRNSWDGTIAHFLTGVPLAVDGPDNGTNVDMISTPATMAVTAADVPLTASLVAA